MRYVLRVVQSISISLTSHIQEIHRVLCPGGVMEAMEEGKTRF